MCPRVKVWHGCKQDTFCMPKKSLAVYSRTFYISDWSLIVHIIMKVCIMFVNSSCIPQSCLLLCMDLDEVFHSTCKMACHTLRQEHKFDVYFFQKFVCLQSSTAASCCYVTHGESDIAYWNYGAVWTTKKSRIQPLLEVTLQPSFGCIWRLWYQFL